MCILLVEDEALIRLLLADELAQAGFEICEAEDGDHAAALIYNPPSAFTLLVTDIHMPGRLDGMQVAHLMRERHPNVPVIYMTGRPDVLRGMRHRPVPGEAVVEKPFTPSEILSVVHRLLGSSSVGGAPRV